MDSPLAFTWSEMIWRIDWEIERFPAVISTIKRSDFSKTVILR